MSEPNQQPSLSDLLDASEAFLNRYIVFKSASHAPVISLWIASTWVFNVFDFTPYVSLVSPVKRCAKSRVIDCAKFLCSNPWEVISATGAVLFRKIASAIPPTVFIDEADTVFARRKGDEQSEIIRAILNAGFEKGAVVPRCVGDKHEIAEFAVYCPKLISGLNNVPWPDTVLDRSVIIPMVRKSRRERVERFRKRAAKTIADPIKFAFLAWSTSPGVADALEDARPALPDELNDRQQDICEPLLAIADMAGGRWPALARRSIIEACSVEPDEESLGIMLLRDLKKVLEAKAGNVVFTTQLLEGLVTMESDGPWAQWWGEAVEKEKTDAAGSKLARILKKFGIKSKPVRIGKDVAKGYARADFDLAFDRYVDDETPRTSEKGVTRVTPPEHVDDQGDGCNSSLQTQELQIPKSYTPAPSASRTYESVTLVTPSAGVQAQNERLAPNNTGWTPEELDGCECPDPF